MTSAAFVTSLWPCALAARPKPLRPLEPRRCDKFSQVCHPFATGNQGRGVSCSAKEELVPLLRARIDTASCQIFRFESRQSHQSRRVSMMPTVARLLSLSRTCLLVLFGTLLLLSQPAEAMPLSASEAALNPSTSVTHERGQNMNLRNSIHWRLVHSLSREPRPEFAVASVRNDVDATAVDGALAHRSMSVVDQGRDGHAALGERLAASLKARGISNAMIVFILSAMPVVELRAGVPVGFLLGLHPAKIFLLAVAGNMLPVFFLLFVLRLRAVQRVAAPLLNRARQKAAGLANSSSLATGLALFVGVPMPGTGAFTGTLIAFVLNMDLKTGIASLGAGVVMSACIMLLLCAMGNIGAALAIAVMLAVGVSSMVHASRGRLQTQAATDFSQTTSELSDLITEVPDDTQTELH